MTAPEDAIVLDIAHRPTGSVLREAETLMRLVPTKAPLLFEVQVDTRDVARLHIGDAATIKLEALPWQQFGLAHGRLEALTPDTLSDDNARETGEDGSSPELKGQARQSPFITARASHSARPNSAICRMASRYGPACASSATSRSGGARSSNTS